MTRIIHDVVQIGYGPVSQVLALALAKCGQSVAVFERRPSLYPLPRAVCIDHEVYRILHTLGLGQELAAVSRPAPQYQWFNADWDELLNIDWTAASCSGGPEVNFVHQPSLEAAMDRLVRAEKQITLNLGWEAITIEEHAERVDVVLRHVASGDTRSVSCKFLIGVDGANSLVRQHAGIERDDRGFEADWLVVDVELNEGVTVEALGIPACGQYCNPTRPTTIVPGGVNGARICRRWEFMRLPHESLQELNDIATLWKLMGQWLSPEQGTVVRHAVYTFRSLIAQSFRARRIMIAGDAAHVMPPFMGQGMCAGMRDAWNLTWKLDLILRGLAPQEILDSYTAERKPHVTDVTDTAIHLGKIICIPDASAAAERDQLFKSGSAPPPAPFPHLTDGLLYRGAHGQLVMPAGKLCPHGEAAWHGRIGRWDEVVGHGLTVIVRGADPIALLDPTKTDELLRLGACFVRVAAADNRDEDFVTDRDGRLLGLFDDAGIDAIVVRPDFYIYGGGRHDQLNQIVESFLRALTSQESINSRNAA